MRSPTPLQPRTFNPMPPGTGSTDQRSQGLLAQAANVLSGVSQPDCPLFIGTSGYSYPEWIRSGFYPPGTSSSRMLDVYAGRFPCTELNFSWYQMPRAEMMERLTEQVPADFLFAVKLTRTMTHEIDPDGWPQETRRFRNGIAPLLQNRQLAAVLIQLPPYFDRRQENRLYLSRLLDALTGLPLAVELRHGSWARSSVFEELSRRKVCLVAVDEPHLPGLFPTLGLVTDPSFFYLRLHGRNKTGWRSGSMQQKFNYHYSDGELQLLLRQRLLAMVDKAKRGYLFFNNHVAGQAPKNAAALAQLARQEGLTIAGAAGSSILSKREKQTSSPRFLPVS